MALGLPPQTRTIVSNIPPYPPYAPPHWPPARQTKEMTTYPLLAASPPRGRKTPPRDRQPSSLSPPTSSQIRSFSPPRPHSLLFTSSLFSYFLFPLAKPNSIFTKPDLVYIAVGIRASPPDFIFICRTASSFWCTSSFLVRIGS